MKIATLNCNGFKACVRKGFWDWFHQEALDILCLQEVRCEETVLVGELAPPEGWFWAQVDAEKKGYSSVAIWSKQEPQQIHRSIGLDWADREGRVVGMEFEKSIVWSIYFPSGTSGDERQTLKEEFLVFMEEKMLEWLDARKAVLVCGDVNIAHTTLDIFHDKSNANKSGFLPHERQWMSDRLAEGWRDMLREVLPTTEIYSWWTSRAKSARENNVGWRIDYQLGNALWGIPVSVEIPREPKISDHAPVIIVYE